MRRWIGFKNVDHIYKLACGKDLFKQTTTLSKRVNMEFLGGLSIEYFQFFYNCFETID